MRSALRHQPAIPAFGQASQETREWARKSRLFAHSISSPDSRFAEIEGEIAESLRPSANIPVLRRLSAETGSITTAARERLCVRDRSGTVRAGLRHTRGNASRPMACRCPSCGPVSGSRILREHSEHRKGFDARLGKTGTPEFEM